MNVFVTGEDRPTKRLGGALRRVLGMGMVETLLTPHGIDSYAELLDPMLTVREQRARLVAVERRTDDSVTLRLRPSRGWGGFRAGQYVSLTVEVDGVRRTRCYSPACADSSVRAVRGGAAETIELTVRRHAEGLVSRYLYEKAVPGQVFGLSAAAGEFVLPTEPARRVILISGGSGITPVMSMLRTLCAQGQAHRVVLLHYARAPESVPYSRELDELARRYHGLEVRLRYTRSAVAGARGGRFTPDDLADTGADQAGARSYLCGPQSLVRAVQQYYEPIGAADRLHTERFSLAPEDTAGNVTGETTFSRSGRSIGNTGQTLLAAAESAGLAPEHGCRMGICFSCTQVKKSGCVRNLRTQAMSADPDEEIQLCISAAVGDVQIDI
ncbi:MAG: ferredoxin reductase [Sciscionella sp.]